MTGKTSHHARCGLTQAFTLVETVSVMVLVGILAFAAVPALHSIENGRAASAANMLLEDVSFARRRAMATGIRQWVELDVMNDSWSVLTESTATPGRASASILVDQSTSQDMTTTLNTGDYVSAAITSADFEGAAVIGFDWRGRPLNSMESDLVAQGSIDVNGTHRIIVEVETGHLRLITP